MLTEQVNLATSDHAEHTKMDKFNPSICFSIKTFFLFRREVQRLDCDSAPEHHGSQGLLCLRTLSL